MHIIPQGSHRKLSVQPTLEEEIRKAQGSDQDLMKIRKHTGENKAPYFRVDDKETLWLRTGFVCLGKENSGILSWTKPITWHIPSTPELPRCIWIWGKNIGGMEWRRPLWYLPKGQSRASEAGWVILTITHSGLEMGWDWHRFCG